MKAIVIERTNGEQAVVLKEFDETELMDGDVTVQVTHSTLNYKDGLALTGKVPVVRRFPMIPGIDFAGVVESSEHPEFKTGDQVLLNGWGTGETHLGAYAEKTRVRGDWLLPLPSGLTPAQTMGIGTAGYSAMLAVLALERHGVKPKHGPAVVTGAAGGVGSFAISSLAKAGWHVIASTGRVEEAPYLREVGAAEVISRNEMSSPGRLLAKERWAAVIDSVGSTTLANVLAHTKYGGAVAACGLAGGMDLPGSVAPFIMRNVALLGVDSVMAPKALRLEAWARIARDIRGSDLSLITKTITLAEVIESADLILSGKVRGRVVVDMSR